VSDGCARRGRAREGTPEHGVPGLGAPPASSPFMRAARSRRKRPAFLAQRFLKYDHGAPPHPLPSLPSADLPLPLSIPCCTLSARARSGQPAELSWETGKINVFICSNSNKK
jgi:hypothetical protein